VHQRNGQLDAILKELAFVGAGDVSEVAGGHGVKIETFLGES